MFVRHPRYHLSLVVLSEISENLRKFKGLTFGANTGDHSFGDNLMIMNSFLRSGQPNPSQLCCIYDLFTIIESSRM